MPFPLAYTVGHRVYSETAERDAHGNLKPGWAAAVEKQVYGWGRPSAAEPKTAGQDREVIDVELLVPPGFVCSHRDRMILDGVLFECVGGVEDLAHNPFGWNPGGVVNLKVVR